jgi:hypothetical protein
MSNYEGYTKNKFNNEKITGANKTGAKDQKKYEMSKQNCAGTYRILMPWLRHFIDLCVGGRGREVNQWLCIGLQMTAHLKCFKKFCLSSVLLRHAFSCKKTSQLDDDSYDSCR